MKIKRLSSATIDKIAAGEVIENPASVVKELVENSIDAGATEISVELVGGGFSLIRVSDNGEGMRREDALICFERHATSKLKTIDDLNHILSMGFRGEALSSIASVSRFSFVTKYQGDDKPATKVSLDGSLKVQEVARTKGTTIEVGALFYNVPARKKFQKSASASLSEVTKIMTRLALAYPLIGFKLVSDGRQVFHVTKNGNLSTRVADVLPSHYCDHSCKIEYEDGLVKAEGVIGLPNETRLNRLGQYLMINHRVVTSSMLSLAMQDAFSTRINAKEHPIFVLHLTIDPSVIDVNVHPQKKEVRLSKERELMQSLKKGVRLALQKHEKVADTPKVNFEFDIPTLDEPLDLKVEPVMKVAEPEPTLFTPKATLSLIGEYGQYALVDAKVFNDVFPSHALDDGLLIFDRKAIYQRLSYDTFLNRLNHQSDEIAMQALLFPVTMEFSQSEAMVIEQGLPILHQLGVELRPFGNNCFILESLAAFFEQDEVKKLIIGLIENVGIKENKLKQIAQYATRFVHFPLTDLQISVSKLLNSSSPFLSPSGQGTIVHIDDMKELFGKSTYRQPTKKNEGRRS